MSVTTIELDGEGFLVDFTFNPRTLFEDWSVEIDGVLLHGMAFHASDEWIKRAEAAILATHGTSLQDAAEEAQFEKQTGAYE
jgi:hypothetical protein